MERGPRSGRRWKLAFVGMEALMMLLITTSCGGGGGSSESNNSLTTTSNTFTLTWDANHEKGVNSPGGGYRVYYSTSPNVNTVTSAFRNVPYLSGPLAPTSVTYTNILNGTYYFRVVAFSTFNPPSGETFRRSSDSAETMVQFP